MKITGFQIVPAGMEAGKRTMVQEKERCSYTQALEVARMTVLKHFDMLLMDVDRMQQEEG